MISARHVRQWANCSASAAEPLEHFPDDPSELAIECEAAAWTVRSVLAGDVSEAVELVSRVSPGGWSITADLAQHVQAFCDAVRQCGRPVIMRDAYALEDHGGVGQIEGIAATDAGGRLHTFHFDYGWDRIEPDDHLMSALLAIVLTDKSVHSRPDLGFVQHVYQPRPYHPLGPWRQEPRSGEELTNMRNWLSHRVAAAHQADARAVAGRQCRRCRHSARCDTLNRYLYAELQFAGGKRGGQRASPADLSRQLNHARLFRTLADEHCKALQLEARARIMAGEWVPGWCNRDGLADRVLTEPAIAAMVTGVPSTRTVVRTPAEMERDGADPALLAKYTTRPRTGPRLTQVSPADAKKAFK